MRLVIDGTAGCGKTTFLTGSSTIYPDEQHYQCIRDQGYSVFSELIRGAIRARKAQGVDPFSDLEDFFRICVERAIDFYQHAEGNKGIYFYDRGLPYLKIMSQRYGYQMPYTFDELCQKYRYDNPVFVFAPIVSHDMRFPKPNEDKGKGYTLEERLKQHQLVMEVYKNLGYDVVEVPVYNDGDIAMNNAKRLSFIKEFVKI